MYTNDASSACVLAMRLEMSFYQPSITGPSNNQVVIIGFLSTVPFMPLCTCNRCVVPYFFHPLGVNSIVAKLSSGELGVPGASTGQQLCQLTGE